MHQPIDLPPRRTNKVNTITTSNAVTCAVGVVAYATVTDQIQQWLYIVVIAISAVATIIGLINTWKTSRTIDKNEMNKLQDDLKKIEDATAKKETDDATKED